MKLQPTGTGPYKNTEVYWSSEDKLSVKQVDNVLSTTCISVFKKTVNVIFVSPPSHWRWLTSWSRYQMEVFSQPLLTNREIIPKRKHF